MENKYTVVWVLAALALLFAGGAAWFAYDAQKAAQGATSITYSAAHFGLETYNLNVALLQDVQALRAGLQVTASSAVAIDWPPVLPTSTQVTSTAVAGAALGDWVLVTPTTNVNDPFVQGFVSAAGTVSLLANTQTSTPTGVDRAAVTYNITVIPKASFGVLPVIYTATTTSP